MTSILDTAFETEIVSPISYYVRDGTPLPQVLDTLLTGKDDAYLEGTITSIVAKITHPDWDTRYHQTQIGGLCSLRNFDKKVVLPWMRTKQLIRRKSVYALTRSLEKAEPFTLDYSAKSKNQCLMKAFLQCVDFLNGGSEPSAWHHMLAYILHTLKKRVLNTNNLHITPTPNECSLHDVFKLCTFISTLTSGASKLPVLLVHTCLSLCGPYEWPGESLYPLNSHTAADSKTRSICDIVYGRVLIAEIKHRIPVDEALLSEFERNTLSVSHSQKYILTTHAKTEFQITSNNTVIDTIGRFVVTMLQRTQFNDTDVCKRFVDAFYDTMIRDSEVCIDIKTLMIEYLQRPV